MLFAGAACRVIFCCSDWHKNRYYYIVSAPLHVILKVMPHIAHRGSLLKEAEAADSEDAPRAAVHVESSDTMRSRKAQCQAPLDNPEPEIHTRCHSSRSRERSCAGQKIEHQNVYKPPRSSTSLYVFIQARPISTIPESMEEACEYGLTHGTCFVARRLEVVAVTGLLWVSWCVLDGADFFVFFFFERTRPAASTWLPCLIYLSNSSFIIRAKRVSN